MHAIVCSGTLFLFLKIVPLNECMISLAMISLSILLLMSIWFVNLFSIRKVLLLAFTKVSFVAHFCGIAYKKWIFWLTEYLYLCMYLSLSLISKEFLKLLENLTFYKHWKREFPVFSWVSNLCYADIPAYSQWFIKTNIYYSCWKVCESAGKALLQAKGLTEFCFVCFHSLWTKTYSSHNE